MPPRLMMLEAPRAESSLFAQSNEPFRMRIYIGSSAAAESCKRNPGFLGYLDGECRRRRYCEDDFDARHRGLLYHLVGGAGADHQRPFGPALLGTQSQKFIEGHMAADVFGAARKRSVDIHSSGSVPLTRESAKLLDLVVVVERSFIVLKVKSLCKGNTRRRTNRAL